MSTFPFLPEPVGEGWQEGVPFNLVEIHNLLWREWVTGKTVPPIGESLRSFSAGDGGAVIQCKVVAFVGQIPGTASLLQLRDISSGAVARGRLQAEFNMPNTVALEAFDSAERVQALEERLRADGHLIVRRIRVPRIVDVTQRIFWPPSREAVERIAALRDSGQPLTFANIEGRDLSRAWEMFERARAVEDLRE